MRGAQGMGALPPALVALILVSVSRAASTIDFSFYPPKAQDCLYRSSNSSSCAAGSVEETNACLCSNGGNFVSGAAKCLGKADPGDLSLVYLTMDDACSNSGTDLTVSEEQYLAAAGMPGTTLTSVQPTSTKLPTTSSSSAVTTSATTTLMTGAPGSQESAKAGADDKGGDKNKKGNASLSTGARAGIIAGGVVVALALLGAVGFAIFWYRRKKDGEESHPMLPQDDRHMSLVPTAAETSALMAIDTPKGDWPTDTKWRPSSNPAEERKSGFNWESPYDLAVPGATLAPGTPTSPGRTPSPPRSPPLTAHSTVSHLSAARSGVFELAGSDRQPAEVPAGPLETDDEPVVIPLPQGEGSQRYSGASGSR
ncbi:hypothetical protein B0H66DRAFT_475700 [Apodospora peruviana]|uniref:Extracellular membrane protein CFEM domain-containing protein n=1 Tax=Apodospora peruviana TaxID=516989 RepID=A0AAE0I687_9PEZI|nr:hypothetical protein B0H66DRAFT_475700 [Apodospora peruviana]